jgi:sulfur transfer complex TusBCD TusB component (DsrH family)
MKGLNLSIVSRIFILLTFLPVISVFSQAIVPRGFYEFVFGGIITEFDDKKQRDVALSGCSVNLYKGSILVTTSPTGGNGRFKLKIPPDEDFVLSISKFGYVTKKIAINTIGIPVEGGRFTYDVEIDLLKAFPGLDYSVLNQPIGRIIYNGLLQPEPNFDYDKAYTAKIQAQLSKLKDLARLAREKLRSYQAAIDAADSYFDNKNWVSAKAKYMEALVLLPDEAYPKNQLAICDVKISESGAEKKKFDDAMAAGEAMFTAANYSGAKMKFKEAQGYRPADPLPPKRIKACEDAMVGADKERMYTDAIKSADQKFTSKDYSGAKDLYKAAEVIKPKEQYPKDRIKECNLLMGLASTNKKYLDAIADADQKFSAKDYTNARIKYVAASVIKPVEQYPKDRIKACDDALGTAGIEKKYADFISEADKKFVAKDFNGAKGKYNEALSVKPTEQYPKERIKACDDELAKNLTNKAYNDLIVAADTKFALKDYATARSKYVEASALKPMEQYPKDRIKACDDGLAGAAKDKLYADAIKLGDIKFSLKDYTTARSKYSDASGIKPSEQYPKDRMKACDDALGSAAKDKLYADAIKDADIKFASKDFVNAKNKYVEASGLKPDSPYPKAQVIKCDLGIAAAGKDKKYDDLIKSADSKFAAKDFSGAKSVYQEAVVVKPGERYPRGQILKCDTGIAAEGKDKAYADVLKDADAKFDARDYSNARSKYVEASLLKPLEQYPKDRIKLCDEAMGAAAKDKKYADVLVDADKKFVAKDFNGAKAKYTEASGMKPVEQYPKDRIKACDDELAKDVKNKAYNDLIVAADTKFAVSEWQKAKDTYIQASTLKPTEQYPKDRIKACDDGLAGAAKEKLYADAIKQGDIKFSLKEYAAARSKYSDASNIKPTEQYPKDRMKACDDAIGNAAKDKMYADAIKDADIKFTAKDFTNAKTKYVEASGLKPDSPYPKDQIIKCDLGIAAAGKEKQYDDLIKSADSKFAAKDFSGAKSVYQEAVVVKPGERYPRGQILKCDTGIAAEGKDKAYADVLKDADAKFDARDYSNARSKYVEASVIKSLEQYPKDRIKMCDDAMGAAAKDKKYTEVIEDADKKFVAKDYNGAKGKYTEASGIKPTEQYPKDRIKACDDELAKDVKNKAYNDLIVAADAKFALKEYATARAKYVEASTLKPTEQYPKDRIKACDDAIAGAANDKLYADAIKDADTKFTLKEYAIARTKYLEAAGLKPTEQYPKDRMKACDDALGAAAKDKMYADAIKEGDTKFSLKDFATARGKYADASGIKPMEQYPKDRMKACDDALGAAAKEKLYTDAIAAADSKFAASDWLVAKTKYSEASILKPTEQYPKDQIVKCDAGIAAAGKEKQYSDLIKSADSKFATKDFSGAKSVYQEAAAVKSAEKYPKDQIKACDDAVASALKDKAYADVLKDADAKFTAKDYSNARSKYVEASGMKPAEQYPKDRIKVCDDAMGAVAKDKKYAEVVDDADKKFLAKDFSGAKGKYTEATGLKPAEQYPKDRIKACDDELAKDLKNKAFNDLIISADAKFSVSEWQKAKDIYVDALMLKPSEQHPKARVRACDEALSALAKDKLYKEVIKDADSKFLAKDFSAARSKYNEASGLKPAEQYPKDRMKACDDALGAAAKDKMYTDVIAAADSKFAGSDWLGAKTKYTEASSLKPAEKYPKDQIAKCEASIAAAGKEKQYTDLLKSADSKFAAKDFSGAKSVYQEAVGVKSSEQYPKDQIKACDDALGAAVIEGQYKSIIASADLLFTSKKWADAKTKYLEAAAVKKSESYPKERIKLCDDNINAALTLEGNYNNFIKRGDEAIVTKDLESAQSAFVSARDLKPTEAYPKQKLDEIARLLLANASDRAYRQLIVSGDSLFKLSNYEEAKKLFTSATTQRPSEQYPKDKLKVINGLIEDAKFAAAKQKKYDDIMLAADKLFAAKDWKGAKDKYTLAKVERPLEILPKIQIEKCENYLNPKPVAVKNAEDPKNNDEYISAIVKKYPKGVTELPSVTVDGAVVTVRVVVVGSKGWKYKMEVYSWGVIYTKDGIPISQATFNLETSPEYVKVKQSDFDRDNK